MSAEARLHRVPLHNDPLVFLADLILRRHRHTLPDLGNLTVVLPAYGAGQRFRRILLSRASKQGYSALIPPANESLASFVRGYEDLTQQTLGDTGRELLLVQALEDFPVLREQYGTWPLIDSLLPLFDDLTLNEVEVGANEREFTRSLTQAYGGSEHVREPLGQEARLVYRLWQAWRETLTNTNLSDRPASYLHALARSAASPLREGHLYIAGIVHCARAELDWLDSLSRRGDLDLVIQTASPTIATATEMALQPLLQRLIDAPAPALASTAYGALLDRALGIIDPALAVRAQAQVREYPNSPADGRLTICALANMEYEARAIDIQVRRWRLKGLRNIGIVTSDRKLARRVRALLERAQIDLADAAGWTLSTTSAAAALNQWLDAIEQDFHHPALLSFLRTPYHELLPGENSDQVLHFLEQKLVKRTRTFRGLRNYQRVLENHSAVAQSAADEPVREATLALLHRLEQAQEVLTSLSRGRTSVDASVCFDGLRASLELLGMTKVLRADPAGIEVLREIESLQRTLTTSTVRLDWTEFRSWLHRQLERARYRPPMRGAGVELMSFSQSRLYCFDAVIIAGAVREHLPGSVANSPFFNDAVRRQLGLDSLYVRQHELLHDFRRLLEAAPHVLITYAREQEGENVEISPWVERLQAFHLAAYGAPLSDGDLEIMALEPGTQLHRDSSPLPETQNQPKVALPVDLLPHDYSSSTYQSLINCPYQFFVRYGLGLRQEEMPEEDLSRSEYGTRVHQILEAFHGGRAGLPGPFRGKMTETNLVQARDLLEDISRKVFLADADRNPINRAWLYRWQDTIPGYLAWLQEREQRWQVTQTELELQRDDSGSGLRLHGRIDRLEQGSAGLGIVDYKTGGGTRPAEVLSGESVQLPFYALLAPQPVVHAMTLVLKPGDVRPGVVLDADELQSLATGQDKRLQGLHLQLQGGKKLSAWGDENSCRYCELGGICRKGLREEPANALPEN